MRIHIVAALYVFVFSLFFDLSDVQYAILFLLFALVMASEMVNTAIERLGDAVSEEKNEKIKIAKDVAAGAVLICAIFAVLIGLIFFFKDLAVWIEIWNYFISAPWLFVVFVAVSFFLFLYIQFGLEKTVKGIIKNLRNKK